jgi:hypothetical protein
MKVRAAILMLFVPMAAGCSTGWERRGVSTPQLVEDTHTCRQVAQAGRLEVQKTVSGLSTLLLPVSEMDDRAFSACMRQHGYQQGWVD